MTNTTSPRETNLDRMADQRRIAELAGFSPIAGDPDGPLRHSSDRLELHVLDDEACWEVAMLETRRGRYADFLIETGRVRLTNATRAQFSAVLAGLVRTVL